jgi:hypothetical protein
VGTRNSVSDDTKALLVLAMIFGTIIVLLLFATSCSENKEGERRKCENGGGVFVDKSSGWECIYDSPGSRQA